MKQIHFWSIFALLAGILFMVQPGEAQAASCGALNQRPCKVWERIPSCNKGLVEKLGKACVRPPAPRRPTKPKVSCGALDQRPCRVWERVPSCNAGLAENFLSGSCIAAGPGHLRRQADQTIRDLKPLVDLQLSVGRCMSASGRVQQIVRLLNAKAMDEAARAVLATNCATRAIEVARRNGYQTMTVGVGGSGQFGLGVNSELGVAFDTADRYVPVGYATIGYTSGWGAALSGDLIVSFYKADSQGIAGDAQGFGYSGKALAGGGAAIWYDYSGRLAGASATGGIGVGGQIGVYNRVTTRVLGPRKALVSARPAPRRPAPFSVEAGPIWNQADAERKCPPLARRNGANWTGHWWTTIPNEMSVCQLQR